MWELVALMTPQIKEYTVEGDAATFEELLAVHSRHYIQYCADRDLRLLRFAELSSDTLKRPRDGFEVTGVDPSASTCNKGDTSTIAPRVASTNDASCCEDAAYGLFGDAEPYAGFWRDAVAIAGGTLKAAHAIARRACHVALHWEGGRHHASFAKAAGFCFVNDVALAASCLARAGHRVMIVDIDAHHGDGTEELCAAMDRVFCFSIHVLGTGIYPGSGAPRFYAHEVSGVMNLALPVGCGSEVAAALFTAGFERAVNGFRPTALVVVCGTDAARGDPLGFMNIEVRCVVDMVNQCLTLNLPSLILGGGGYRDTTAARIAASVSYACFNKTLPPVDVAIPLDCSALPMFGPGFGLYDDEPSVVRLVRDWETVIAKSYQAIQSMLGSIVQPSRSPSTERSAESEALTASSTAERTDDVADTTDGSVDMSSDSSASHDRSFLDGLLVANDV